jgi:hypothetical protein
VRNKLHLILIALFLLGSLITLSPAKAGPPYYYRWSSAPNATCTQNVGSVAVSLASQPVEWDVPAGAQYMIIYIPNGAASPTGPFVLTAGTGSHAYGAFAANVPGTYPITYSMQLDTYVGGILVYSSSLTVNCTADSASITPTITSQTIAAPPSFYRWSSAPNATCTQNVGSVAVSLASQPVEWDVPAGSEYMIIYIPNGVASPTGPFPLAAGTGSHAHGAFAANVPGTYPITYSMRLDTFVNSVLVYTSTLTVSCSADSGSVTPTVTNVSSSASFASGLAGSDMVPLPSTAVVGAFVTTTPAYFAPRADAVTTVIITAGKTLWILGVDDNGDFYKVVMAGRYFWVPVDTMGPNFDNVWQGRPLPTNVVS